jgi:hypothetical protein
MEQHYPQRLGKVRIAAARRIAVAPAQALYWHPVEKKKITRWRAAGLHLLISVAIALAVLALLLFVWYPWPMFEAAGGRDLLLILVGVDVVVGPLITLIVFRLGKRGLKLDLAVIGAIQLAALLYGANVMFLARPAFIVFVKDQFQVASAVDLEPAELEKAKFLQFRHPPRSGPILAYAEMPTDPAEKQKLVLAAFGGLDMEYFPQHFVPYADRAKEVLAVSWPIERVRKEEPLAAKVVDEYLARSGTKESDVRYVRMRARQAWLAVLIDAKTAEVVKMLIAEKI